MSLRVSPISPSVLSRFASSQFLSLRLAPLSASDRTPAITSALERALKPFPSLPAPCDRSGPIRQVAFPRQNPEVLRPHEPDRSKSLASTYSGDSAHHRAVKWSPETVVLDIHIRPVIEQPLHNVENFSPACCM